MQNCLLRVWYMTKFDCSVIEASICSRITSNYSRSSKIACCAQPRDIVDIRDAYAGK